MKHQTQTENPSIIIICGSTGIGKTHIAIELAKIFGGQIINADSMQVYRNMDIGTAKPTANEQNEVKHHIINVVDPNEPFNASIYSKIAQDVVIHLHQNNIPIFVVGGTGLYIRALIQGIFPNGTGHAIIRNRLKQEAHKYGNKFLYERLQTVDPDAAKRIHINDIFRIIRALEVFESTGLSLSDHHKNQSSSHNKYRTLFFGLTMERDALYQRINQRVDEMISVGLLDEVRSLLNKGYSSNLKPMRSLGYRHMCDYIENRCQWADSIHLMKRDTRRYAKRQITWFRANPTIQWMMKNQIDVMKQLIEQFLNLK